MVKYIARFRKFRKGSDLYFQKHDGQAVTCEDFISAMEQNNQFDLSQFQLWYEQKGTPNVEVVDYYDPEKKIYTLIFKQILKDENKPLLIPVRVVLLSPSGQSFDLILQKDVEYIENDKNDFTLILRKEIEFFTFLNVPELPVASLLRNFSAPININYYMNNSQLLFLALNDEDLFNRWSSIRSCI